MVITIVEEYSSLASIINTENTLWSTYFGGNAWDDSFSVQKVFKRALKNAKLIK